MRNGRRGTTVITKIIFLGEGGRARELEFEPSPKATKVRRELQSLANTQPLFMKPAQGTEQNHGMNPHVEPVFDWPEADVEFNLEWDSETD
jgi:hypothetical protein